MRKAAEEMMNAECRIQNKDKKLWRRMNSFCVLHFAFCISALLMGCKSNTNTNTTAQTPAPAPPPQPPASLIAANQALATQQPDVAIADAQQYLRSQPSGPYAAQAWYMEGRGYYMKVAGSPAESQRNLSQARTCYLEALQKNPDPALEGDIRAEYANVAFFQDDFAETIQQASAAMPLEKTPQTNAFLLLRIGMSQQRLGRFTDADQTFRQVMQRYPGTPIAESAREHEGQNNFYVQLATYTDKKLADQAMGSVQNSGVILSQRTDAKGNTIIDAGPYSTYSDAKKVKVQLQANFPQALIVP
jgi:tetratricopeptide (TPR) repeat protein